MLYSYLQQKVYNSCIFVLTITIFVVSSEILRLKKCNKWAGIFTVSHQDKKLMNCLTITLRNIKTSSACSHACYQHNKCETISYNSLQNICLLHEGRSDGAGGATIKDESGWVIFETSSEAKKQIGPVCVKTNPCQHGSHCIEQCNHPGYSCQCKEGYYGYNCESKISSCNDVKNTVGINMISGYYKILIGNVLIPIYCEMTADQGGWMMIANITTEDPSPSSVSTYLDDNPLNLASLQNTNYALSSIGLQALHKVTPFTQLRIYCHKPSVGTYVDIMTSTTTDGGLDIFNYLVFGVEAYDGAVAPIPCGSYVALPKDTSSMASSCPAYKYSVVSDNTRLYTFPIYTYQGSNAYHISIGEYNTRFECDDYEVDNSLKQGNWIYYVR